MRFRAATKNDAQQIGVELFQDVVSAGVCQVDAPILEDALGVAISLRIIRGGNSLLQQQSKNLRRVERRTARVRARDHRACRGIAEARPRGAVAFAEIARILLQNVGQKTIDEESGGGLIAFGASEALRGRSPSFPVVGVRVAGLLQHSLKGVPEVRADIGGLM